MYNASKQWLHAVLDCSLNICLSSSDLRLVQLIISWIKSPNWPKWMNKVLRYLSNWQQCSWWQVKGFTEHSLLRKMGQSVVLAATFKLQLDCVEWKCQRSTLKCTSGVEIIIVSTVVCCTTHLSKTKLGNLWKKNTSFILSWSWQTGLLIRYQNCQFAVWDIHPKKHWEAWRIYGVQELH